MPLIYLVAPFLVLVWLCMNYGYWAVVDPWARRCIERWIGVEVRCDAFKVWQPIEAPSVRMHTQGNDQPSSTERRVFCRLIQHALIAIGYLLSACVAVAVIVTVLEAFE